MKIFLALKCFLGIILLTPLFFNCSQPNTISRFPLIISSDGPATIGDIAPNFSWVGQDNVKRNLSDFRGKPVIIFTWDIACTWCTDVMLKHLNENYSKYKDQGIEIITINDGDSDFSMATKLKDKSYPFMILRDSPIPEYKFRSPYKLKRGNPWIVLINKNGILVDENGIFTNPIDASEKDLQNIINDFIRTQ